MVEALRGRRHELTMKSPCLTSAAACSTDSAPLRRPTQLQGPPLFVSPSLPPSLHLLRTHLLCALVHLLDAPPQPLRGQRRRIAARGAGRRRHCAAVAALGDAAAEVDAAAAPHGGGHGLLLRSPDPHQPVRRCWDHQPEERLLLRSAAACCRRAGRAAVPSVLRAPPTVRLVAFGAAPSVAELFKKGARSGI